jgi:hypothetical protein
LAERETVPKVWTALQFRGKVGILQSARALRDLRAGLKRYPKAAGDAGDVMLGESVGALWPGVTDACGIDDRGSVVTVAAGDVSALEAAVERSLLAT